MKRFAILAAISAVFPMLHQARDASMSPIAAGTASISGTVVVDDAIPAPVRRARVSLTTVGQAVREATLSDDEGRFQFSGLAAGAFIVAASRTGFVSIAFGATRPGRPGTPLAIADGQRTTGVVLHLLRGAVIDGTIRDPSGTPAADTAVSLREVRSVNGVRTMTVVTTIGDNRTDDRGHYRLFGLAPGEYLVSVDPPSFGLPVRSVHQVTRAEIARASGRGAASVTGVAAADSVRPIALAPVYYSGTAVLSAAVPVRLKAGEEQSGIDFRLEFVVAATVSGTVARAPGVDTDIAPAEPLRVQLRPIADGSGAASSAAIDREGAFRLVGIAPGEYELTAQWISGAGRSGAVTAAATSSMLWMASTDVVVDGRDISGVTLTLAPAPTIAGRVVFKDGSPTPDELAKMSIQFSPLRNGAVAKIGVDATFATKSVRPGAFTLSLSPATGTDAAVWWLESAQLGGRDVTHDSFEVRGGQDVRDLVLTLRKGLAGISGVLKDAGGGAASSYYIVAFAMSDGRYKTSAATRPASDGRFNLKGLVPGEYRIASAADVDPSDLFDAAFLESLVPASSIIRLAAGETKQMDFVIK